MVTMEYAMTYLQNEIGQSVNACLLMYGKQQQQAKNENGKIAENAKSNRASDGNIFARPTKKIPRIALLPVASYQIAQNENEQRMSNRKSNESAIGSIGLLNHGLYGNEDKQSDADADSQAVIAEKLNDLKTGAMTQANTLWKNFGSMFQ